MKVTMIEETGIIGLVSLIYRRIDELGISQEEFAHRCGLGRGSLSNILSGKVKRAPNQDTMDKLAKGLDMRYEQLDRLVRGKKEPNPEPTNAPGVPPDLFTVSEDELLAEITRKVQAGELVNMGWTLRGFTPEEQSKLIKQWFEWIKTLREAKGI